jgi:hypothetical protein
MPEWVSTVTYFHMSVPGAPKLDKKLAEQDAAERLWGIVSKQTVDGNFASPYNAIQYEDVPAPIMGSGFECKKRTGTPESFALSSHVDPEVNADKRFYRLIAELHKLAPVSSRGQTEPYPEPSPEPRQKRPLFLIDLENLAAEIPDGLNPRDIYGFHSTFSTVSARKYENKLNLMTIDMGSKEAADHYMTYTAAKLTQDRDPATTLIVVGSRDLSSAVLVHILKDEGFKTKHVKTPEELLDAFHSSYKTSQR